MFSRASVKQYGEQGMEKEIVDCESRIEGKGE